MFGLIVSGRMVETCFQPVDMTNFLSVIADADKVNHVVVFLTGTTPFPEGAAGLIYFCWPDLNGPPNWQLLGYISNDKPSAVFQVSGMKRTRGSCIGASCTGCGETGCLAAVQNPWSPQFGQQPIAKDAQIGISVSPVNVVMEQVAMLESTKLTANPRPLFAEFSEKMLENFMNFASSFALTQNQMIRNPTESYIPLNVLQNWYNSFQRRLSINPYFWKS